MVEVDPLVGGPAEEGLAAGGVEPVADAGEDVVVVARRHEGQLLPVLVPGLLEVGEALHPPRPQHPETAGAGVQNRPHRALARRQDVPPGGRVVGVDHQLPQAAVAEPHQELGAAAADGGDGGVHGVGEGAVAGRAGVGAHEGVLHRRPDEAGVVVGRAAPGAGEQVLGEVEALPGVGAPVGEHGQVPPLAVGGHGPDVAEGIVADGGDLPAWGDQGRCLEEGVAPAHVGAPGAPDIAPAGRQHPPRRPLGTEGWRPRDRGGPVPRMAEDLVPEGHPEVAVRGDLQASEAPLGEGLPGAAVLTAPGDHAPGAGDGGVDAAVPVLEQETRPLGQALVQGLGGGGKGREDPGGGKEAQGEAGPSESGLIGRQGGEHHLGPPEGAGCCGLRADNSPDGRRWAPADAGRGGCGESRQHTPGAGGGPRRKPSRPALGQGGGPRPGGACGSPPPCPTFDSATDPHRHPGGKA